MPPDPRPPKRIRDTELLRVLHLGLRSCSLCGEAGGRMSLHHIHRHPRDDVLANLVMLCGDGTTGCHGDVEHHEPVAMEALRTYIVTMRADTIGYLAEKLGGQEQAMEWVKNLTRVRSTQ